MKKSWILYPFLTAAATWIVLTCGPIPPPAPDVDLTTVQPEITIVPPHTELTVDTVGTQITIKVKLRYSSALDSVLIIVKGKTSTGADTIEMSQRVTEDDFVGDSMTISYLPLTPGAKTVTVTACFPNDTKNTADYVLNVATFTPSIIITPPHSAQIIDTVGAMVTFGINHTFTDFLHCGEDLSVHDFHRQPYQRTGFSGAGGKQGSRGNRLL